jgi:F-type H+-transporting ATPase subunit delta
MMLRGASAEAMAELAEQARARTLGETAAMGEELFAVAGILRGDAALRRALTDNSVEAEAKSGLARAVFGKALGDPALSLVTEAASRRWTAGRDLSAALAHLAAVVTVKSAGRDGRRVGDELFAVRRLIDTNPELRSALSDRSRTSEDRSALLHDLLGTRILPATSVLVGQAITAGDGSVDTALDQFLDIAAEAMEETVATVHTARELSAEEQQRLETALSKQYDSGVQVHVVIDEDLIGGLRVEIGDDVIDGTVVNRLDEARRRLAG